jgi:hypothetical protein
VRIFAGTLELPQRSPQAAADARLSSFGAPESAPPQKPTVIRRGDLRVEHIDRLDLELGTHGKSQYPVEENDPLSAVAELGRTQMMSRNAWQIRIETQIRLSSTADMSLLQGGSRAWEGEQEVCHRNWDRSIPRDFI